MKNVLLRVLYEYVNGEPSKGHYHNGICSALSYLMINRKIGISDHNYIKTLLVKEWHKNNRVSFDRNNETIHKEGSNMYFLWKIEDRKSRVDWLNGQIEKH